MAITVTEYPTAQVQGGPVVTEANVTFTRPANATGYTAGDVVSNSDVATTLMAFPLAAVPGGRGEITKVRIWTNVDAIVPVYTIHFFTASEATVSVPADNAAMTAIYVNDPYYVGSLTAAALASAAGTDTASFTTLLPAVPLAFRCVAGSRTLYAVLVDGTGVAAASGQAYSISLTARSY